MTPNLNIILANQLLMKFEGQINKHTEILNQYWLFLKAKFSKTPFLYAETNTTAGVN